jgi:hypothetical protein
MLLESEKIKPIVDFYVNQGNPAITAMHKFMISSPTLIGYENMQTLIYAERSNMRYFVESIYAQFKSFIKFINNEYIHEKSFLSKNLARFKYF